MNFNKIVNEIKGDLCVGDEVIIPNSRDTWTIQDMKDDEEYFTLKNSDGEETTISVYNISKIKKNPILEKTDSRQKAGKVAQHESKISLIEDKMKNFGNNSKKSKKYLDLMKELHKTKTALKIAKKIL